VFDDDQDAGPVLSDEETGALLDAMREEEASRGPEARDAELASGEGPLREYAAQADRAASAVAEACRTQLLRQVGVGVAAEPGLAEVVPREVLESALDPHGLLYTLVDGEEVVGLIAVDSRLARFVLVRCMGATEVAGPEAPAGALSELDRRIIHEFPTAVAAAVAAEVREGRRLTLRTPDPGPMSDKARFEPLLRLDARLSQGDEPIGEVVVALTADAVRAPARAAVRHANGIEQHVDRIEVQVAAVLGRAASSVRALLELGVGDVLRLDRAPGDPVALCVEHLVVALGDPVVHRGDLALTIQQPPTTGESRP